MKKILFFLIIFSLPHFLFAALSCTVKTAALCLTPDVVVLRMSGATNAHSELPSQSTLGYALNAVCCGGLSGIGSSCSGTYATVAKLSSTTNAHIEQNTFSNFTNPACISVPSGTVTIAYQNSNCTGYDTTLASMTNSTNAHIGSPADYTIKICGSLGTAPAQSLSFSISDNSIGFGTLSAGAPQYATGDTLGSASEVEANNLIVNTNASSGYTVTVQGATLTAGSYTIDAIGGTNTASSVGTEQFGLRMTATGGSGIVSSPYAASGFAYAATASTPSTVATASSGTGVDTTYSARYIANIAGNTETGNYTTNLIYVATANF